jgi:hypothetical protein
MRLLTGKAARRAPEDGKVDAGERVLDNPSQHALFFAAGAP